MRPAWLCEDTNGSTTVQAFICPQSTGSCINPLPATRYVYAVAGSALFGGWGFITDLLSRAPQGGGNSLSDSNKLGEVAVYWTGRDPGQSIVKWDPANHGAAIQEPCLGFTSSASHHEAFVGTSDHAYRKRWHDGARSCDQRLRLICMVHPIPSP